MREPRWVNWLSRAMVIIFVLIAVTPFLWVTLTSLKGAKDYYASSETRTILPQHPTFENYRVVLASDSSLLYYFRNSMLVTLFTLCIVLLCSVLGAYAFARFTFPAKEPLFLLFIGAMMLPGEAMLVSLYDLLNKLGFLNTLHGLVLPTAALALPTMIFILRGVFEQIPKELEEAARIDGCGALRVLWHVILPNSRAGLASIIVLTFLAAWNDFGLPLVLTNTKDAQTLTVGIALLKNQFGEYEVNQLCAVAVMAMLPALLLFFAIQKAFVRGLMSGAIKE